MERFLAPDDAWCVTEARMDPALTKHYEGAFTQGNGAIHLRASYEEGLAAAPQDEEYLRTPANVTLEAPRHPRSKCGLYLPGIVGHHPLLNEVMLNLPNPLCLAVRCGGQALDMDLSRITGYSRTLDLRDAVLYRDFLWHAGDADIRCHYRRYVSMDQPWLIVQQATFLADRDTCLELEAVIDTKVRTNGYNHFIREEWDTGPESLQVRVDTDAGERVFLGTALSVDGRPLPAGGRQIRCSVSLKAGCAITVNKLAVVISSRDTAPPSFAEVRKKLAAAAAERQSLYAAHAGQWNALWRGCGVSIEGDAEMQRAVNFNLYHLLRAAHPGDDRVAVCAKGFAGEAYFGHFFWDTEIYLLPFYLYTCPPAAEALVRYRQRTLTGAMANARRTGYSGAKYAWEASLSGEEQCPNWQYADHEVHINTAVTHGAWHLMAAAGQPGPDPRYREIFEQTALYWLERVHLDEKGGAHINGVMGPDEYLCFCNDNAYTNDMVRRALSQTLEYQAQEGHSDETPLISGALAERLRQIQSALAVKKTQDGVTLQCTGFDKLEPVDFDAVWPDRSRPFGTFVSQERNYRSAALKQADVLMTPFLFWDAMGDEELRANYDYYFPLTTHDSSLSYVVHAALAARLDACGQAYELFRAAALLDLEHDAGEGVHIANCGGVWQALVRGFCGMRWAYEAEDLTFTPHLPPHWKRVRFPLLWRGQRRMVTITHREVRVEPEE